MPSPVISAPPTSVAPMAAPASSGAGAADALASLQGNGTIGADFAALLLAQMGAAADGPGLPVTPVAESSEDSETPSGDLSALFAALSLAPPPGQNTAIKTEASGDALSGAGKGAAAIGGDALGSAVGDNLRLNAQGGNGANAGGNDAQDGKSAKFAAFDATLKQAEAKADISAPVMPEAPAAVHSAHQAHGSPNTNNTAALQARVDTPVRDPAFGQEFSQKIVWMAGQDKQTAQLSLNPPQLGPVEISLKITGDQATAVFASPHAEVREAIEAALPRLREMMSSAGLELGQANVSSQSFQQQQQQQAQQSQGGNARAGSPGGILDDSPNGAASTSGTQAIRQGNGLVDTFV